MLRAPVGKHYTGIYKTDTDYTGHSDMKRKISMTIYYPAITKTKECDYMDVKYQRECPGPKENGVNTYCYIDAPIVQRDKAFPVVLFNHGLCGFEMESTVLCSDLASSGYVVVSIGHPYGAGIVTYCDGTKFENPEPPEKIRYRLKELEPLWYEDIRAVIRQLEMMNITDGMWKGKIDFENMGVAGVSFGGCCSVVAALKDEKLKYAVNLDGSLFVKPNFIYMDKPILILCSPFNIKAYYELVSTGCSKVFVHKIKKVKHWEFSDGVYLGDKGKSNREWADNISKSRFELIDQFINNTLV